MNNELHPANDFLLNHTKLGALGGTRVAVSTAATDDPVELSLISCSSSYVAFEVLEEAWLSVPPADFSSV